MRVVGQTEAGNILIELSLGEVVTFVDFPPSAEALGEALRGYRKKNSLSQQAFAKMAGLSRNYISQIERGLAGNISFSVYSSIVSIIES